MANKLIIAHMSKTAIKTFDITYFGLIFIVIFQILQKQGYLGSSYQLIHVIYLATFYVSVELVIYLTGVYKEIASHLGIEVFRIKYVKE